MSNVTSGSPLKLDTAVANWAALNLPNSIALDVRQLYWEGSALAGDTVQITDADGLVLWEATAEAAAANPGNTLTFYFQPRSLMLTKNQGWFLKTIDSGVLWVYFVTS